ASQSPANMSRISDALVARELITRDSSVQDRRKMVLRITDEGAQFVRQLLPKLWAPLRAMLRDFPETDQQQLTVLLKRLGIKLDEVGAAAVTEPAQ
ncbi:MAG TPA: MarR family transcriptional regulator, partial [Steroidobacteraceae bacterium]